MLDRRSATCRRTMLATMLAATAAAIILLAGPAAASTEDPAPARYDDHQVVELDLERPRDFQRVMALGARPWSCRVGPGVGQYLVDADQLDVIRRMGIEPDVVIDDVQAALEHHQQLNEQARAAAAGAGDWFDAYRTWPEVNDYIDDLVDLQPDIAEKIHVGDSHEGREIYGMRISGPGENKPAVLFNGCQHAREWIAVMVPMYIADQLVRNYETDPEIKDLVDRVEFFIVPIVNPDGYEYSYAPNGDRFWRKNRRPNSFCTGVDLNRNWDIDWNGGNSTSTWPCSEIYVGPEPMSEAETQAMAAFVTDRPQIRTHIDFHNYSELVLHPYGYTTDPVPDYENVEQIASDMSDAIYDVHGVDYPHGTPGQLLYFASGIFPDWSYDQFGTFGYTIEVRPSSSNPGFLLPPEQIIPTCEENFAAALTIAEATADGVAFTYPDGLPETIDPADPPSLSVNMTPVTSGPLDPLAATLYTRPAGASSFTATPVEPQVGPAYLAEFPDLPCGETIEYFFEIAAETGVTYADPPGDSYHTVEVSGSTCVADLTCDGSVGGADLGQLLSAWGDCEDCAEDLTGDGTVGGADLGELLANWGPCQ